MARRRKAAPDRCQHPDWHGQAQVIRETETDGGPVVGWVVEFGMTCVTCLAPMQWTGIPVGPSRFMGTADDAGLTLILPCRPFSVAASS